MFIFCLIYIIAGAGWGMMSCLTASSINPRISEWTLCLIFVVNALIWPLGMALSLLNNENNN